MQQTLLTGIWVGMAAVLGFLIGSFLNVCIYRLPAGITIVRGHSFCPNCKHPLGSLDLVPVFSYVLLGRRCRYCHQPISSRYARIELLSGAYFALAAFLWEPGRFSLPDWLSHFAGGSLFSDQITSRLQASLFLVLAAALAFSGLLVWAMIIWDEKIVPRGLFLFALLPVIIRLALQPENLVSHLFAMGLSVMIFALLAWFNLLPESTQRQKLQFGAGLGLLGLMSGLWAIEPVLMILLIELMLLAIKGKQEGQGTRRQSSLLWRSLPLQCLLVAAVAWLFF